jgi:DNA polymerase-3 subunit delta
MKYPELLTQIGQGQIYPVYLFHGAEGLLMEEALKKLKESVLTPGFEDLNYHLFTGSSIRPPDIIQACQTLPFLSSKRLVVVRDIESMAGSEGLIAYLDHPSSSTCLVLVAGKADPKKRLFSVLVTKGKEVIFFPLNDSQTRVWIKEISRSMGIALTVEAIAYLQERLGNDLYQLRNELEKLSLITEEPGPRDVEAIQAILTGERDHTVFEWLNALRECDSEKAIRLLNTLLDSGEYPLSLLGLVLSHLRKIARSGEERMPIKGMGRVDLAKAFSLCLEADSQLKGSRLSPQLILETFLLNLCGKNAQRKIKGSVGTGGGLSSGPGFWP